MNGMSVADSVWAGIGIMIVLWLIFKAVMFVLPRIVGVVLGIILTLIAAPFVLLKNLLFPPKRKQGQPGTYTVTYYHDPTANNANVSGNLTTQGRGSN